ncbi:MAG: Asp-tRNA(Asn)/Glu-tRNA(Gln) amidotransferase subunit GatC [Patescibacteria group bacterium]
MFSNEDTEKIAKLVKFKLTASEIEKLTPLLGVALEYVEILKTLDTSSTEGTYEITGLKNVFSEDVCSKSLSQDAATANAKLIRSGYIVTSAVIEK